MLVYHVGFNEIKNPDVFYGRKNADFGQGFYLTDDREFSYRWAKERSGEDTILNTYELDYDGLQLKEFERDEAWFEYIYQNRHRMPDNIDADVICGPISNDIIYDVMGITTSGLLPKEDSMALLMLGPKYRQIVLKSEKAALHLKWISSEIIPPEKLKEYAILMAKEEAEYQKLFAEKLEELSD